MKKNAMFREFLENISDMDPVLIDNIQEAFGAVYESEDEMDEPSNADINKYDDKSEESYTPISELERTIDAQEAAANQSSGYAENFVATYRSNGECWQALNAAREMIGLVLELIRSKPEFYIEPNTIAVSGDFYSICKVPTDALTPEEANAFRLKLQAGVWVDDTKTGGDVWDVVLGKNGDNYIYTLERKGSGSGKGLGGAPSRCVRR